MATYLITYDDGSDQKLTVDTLVYDGDQYIARTGGQTTAYIRPLDVRSIVLMDSQACPEATGIPVRIDGPARHTPTGVVPCKDTQTGAVGKIYLGGTELNAHIEAVVNRLADSATVKAVR